MNVKVILSVMSEHHLNSSKNKAWKKFRPLRSIFRFRNIIVCHQQGQVVIVGQLFQYFSLQFIQVVWPFLK